MTRARHHASIHPCIMHACSVLTLWSEASSPAKCSLARLAASFFSVDDGMNREVSSHDLFSLRSTAIHALTEGQHEGVLGAEERDDAEHWIQAAVHPCCVCVRA